MINKTEKSKVKPDESNCGKISGITKFAKQHKLLS